MLTALLSRCCCSANDYHWIDLAKRMRDEPNASLIRCLACSQTSSDNGSEVSDRLEEIPIPASTTTTRVKELVIMLANGAARGPASFGVQPNEFTPEQAGHFVRPRACSECQDDLTRVDRAAALFSRQPGYGASYITRQAARRPADGQEASASREIAGSALPCCATS